MCIILAVKRLKEATPALETNLKNIMYEKMLDNPDGFFIHTNDNKYFRTLSMDRAGEYIEDSDVNGMVLHARIKTTGAVTFDNVHGWRFDNWQGCHNGWVNNYVPNFHDKDKQEKSDSNLFFETLFPKLKGELDNDIVAETIHEECRVNRFSGRALLHDLKHDKLFMFGDFQVYLLNESYLVISSATLNFEDITRYVNVMGFYFKDKEKISITVRHQKSDGVGVIENWGTAKAKYTQLMDKLDSGFGNSHPYYSGKKKKNKNGPVKTTDNKDVMIEPVKLLNGPKE